MDRKCLIVTYYFPPTGGGGVQRLSKLIKYLSGRGWKFSVICADEKNALQPHDPTLLAELPGDLDVRRIPFKAPAGKMLGLFRPGFLLRWLSSLLYLPDSRKKWSVNTIDAVSEKLSDKKYDIVLFSIPPYSLALSAAQLAGHISAPLVLDMRDPWSDNPYKIHPTPLHRLIDRHLEKRTLRKLPFIVSAYSGPVAPFADSASHKIAVIPNGYDEADFDGLEYVELEKDCFHLAFSGTFYSHLNHPRPLFKAFAYLKTQAPHLYKRLRFHHIGSSAYPLRKTAERFGLGDILVEWGYKEHPRALSILNAMSAFCFILDSRHRHAGNTIGGKVYEYLRLTKPVLALVPERGAAADLINACNAGKVIDPQNTRAICDCIIGWMEKRSLPKPDQPEIAKYERSRLAEQYHSFLSEIVESGH